MERRRSPHNWGPVGRGMPWNLWRYLAKYWGVRRLYGRRNRVPERGAVPPPPASCGRGWSVIMVPPDVTPSAWPEHLVDVVCPTSTGHLVRSMGLSRPLKPSRNDAMVQTYLVWTTTCYKKIWAPFPPRNHHPDAPRIPTTRNGAVWAPNCSSGTFVLLCKPSEFRSSVECE